MLEKAGEKHEYYTWQNGDLTTHCIVVRPCYDSHTALGSGTAIMVDCSLIGTNNHRRLIGADIQEQTLSPSGHLQFEAVKTRIEGDFELKLFKTVEKCFANKLFHELTPLEKAKFRQIEEKLRNSFRGTPTQRLPSPKNNVIPIDSRRKRA